MSWVHLYVDRHLKRNRNEVEYIIIKCFDNFNYVLIIVFRVHNIFVYYRLYSIRYYYNLQIWMKRVNKTIGINYGNLIKKTN